ncbi:MAG: phosphoribosylamine--glycine ligase [Corynebacterium camporealensis]|uniref:phosphoribosylamine--glycine ligase n=1 Tax=Corynebacterium camporealensis TaxID=161896 RepID=UPI002A911FE8|nr:phosphoribosylamine--glycine ligase [Corynebacterium camporealensis]MDY5840992.1 phosphoribosylamine--glycine ligase [Corynebacterium camporealensis]
MRILVIGSGGREHALLKGLHADSLTTELHAAPGAPAFAELATNHSEYSQVDDPARMLELAQKIEAELVVVGPEVPLVAGVADMLREQGIAVFGPSKEAAQIEGSKAFAKDVMAAADVATARAEQVSPDASDDEIAAALDRFGPHYVVKDDGLAGGKGVVVTEDRSVALDHIHAVHSAGNPVLLESFLEGPEVSLFCLVDGETVVPLLPAQDHKRAYDNDEGPNTGGMGAYTPLPWLPEDGVERIVKEVCEPVAKEMVKRGTPYNGLLYAGLAWGPEGPAVVEFNCRFGDPETQAVLSLLESPLAEALNATATGKLAELEPLKWKDGYAVTVVLAAEGYPASPRKGGVIEGEGLDDPQRVLHAGTKLDEDNNVVANGGRVLNVLGAGSTLAEAREKAYDVLEGLKLEGGFYRRDIGKRAQDGEISI